MEDTKMKNTVEKIFEDTRYNMACTYIVNCMGVTDIFTRETKSKLLRVWGKEEARVHFLNTREVVINVL
jgi:hypothetical protein